MSKILKVKNVNDYCNWLGYESQHPQVCVIDYKEVSPIRHCLANYSVYGIFFHDEAEIDLTYGCGKYDYKKGLEKTIKNYTFFDYRINEALHMSEEEHDILVSLMHQMRDELSKKHDEQQNAIIVGYIELMLNFCQRFYNRQFLTRKLENSDILMRFNSLLQDYYENELCMSSNYFGDLIKKTTGDTASNHIRQYIIQRAKNELISGATASQVAYNLGFDYPQHLSRLFKKCCGCSPTEYVKQKRNDI